MILWSIPLPRGTLPCHLLMVIALSWDEPLVAIIHVVATSIANQSHCLWSPIHSISPNKPFHCSITTYGVVYKLIAHGPHTLYMYGRCYPHVLINPRLIPCPWPHTRLGSSPLLFTH